MTRVTLQQLRKECGSELLKADAEWVTKYPDAARLRADRRNQLEENARPLLVDLAEAGYPVASVWDLIKSTESYHKAVPVLVKHLQGNYLPRTRSGIARALATPEAAWAWPLLVDLYLKEPNLTDGLSNEVKQSLAVAVADTTEEKNIGALLHLAQKQFLGESRILLLDRLQKSKSAIVQEALMDLRQDPDLHKEIARWLKKRKR